MLIKNTWVVAGAAFILGFALCYALTLNNNRICFKNGECKTFYTAQDMKDWLYEVR